MTVLNATTRVRTALLGPMTAVTLLRKWEIAKNSKSGFTMFKMQDNVKNASRGVTKSAWKTINAEKQ